MDTLLPSTRLANLRFKVSREPPPGFTDLMLSLLSNKLDSLERVILRIESICVHSNCREIISVLDRMVSEIEAKTLSGDKQVFDLIDAIFERVRFLSSYISLRNSMTYVASMSAGAVISLAALTQVFNPESYLTLLTSVFSTSLAIAGMLLSTYFTGQVLIVISAILLALSPKIVYAVIASIATFLTALAIMIKKGTYGKLKGVKLEAS